MGFARDVTRDSVIITRDSSVIRNHTAGKPQGHKNANRAQRQSKELTFGGSNQPTEESITQLIEASPADFGLTQSFPVKNKGMFRYFIVIE